MMGAERRRGTPMELKDRIAAVRRAAGLTQEQLGELLGVSRQAVSRWESGQTSPDVSTLAALCEKLRVSADYVLLGKEPGEGQSTGPAYEPPDTCPAAGGLWRGRSALPVVLLCRPRRPGGRGTPLFQKAFTFKMKKPPAAGAFLRDSTGTGKSDPEGGLCHRGTAAAGPDRQRRPISCRSSEPGSVLPPADRGGCGRGRGRPAGQAQRHGAATC